MALLAIQKALLSLILLFGGGGCVGGPDEFTLGGGHTFMGDSSLEGWQMRNDDSNMVFASFTWRLGPPAKVEVVNPVAPAVRWTLQPETGEPKKQEPPEATREVSPPQEPAQVPTEPVVVDDAHPTAASHVEQDVTEAIESFDAMHWLTRLLLAVLAGWILWIYRAKIGSWIPGRGRNGESKKKPKA